MALKELLMTSALTHPHVLPGKGSDNILTLDGKEDAEVPRPEDCPRGLSSGGQSLLSLFTSQQEIAQQQDPFYLTTWKLRITACFLFKGKKVNPLVGSSCWGLCPSPTMDT